MIWEKYNGGGTTDTRLPTEIILMPAAADMRPGQFSALGFSVGFLQGMEFWNEVQNRHRAGITYLTDICRN